MTCGTAGRRERLSRWLPSSLPSRRRRRRRERRTNDRLTLDARLAPHDSARLVPLRPFMSWTRRLVPTLPSLHCTTASAPLLRRFTHTGSNEMTALASLRALMVSHSLDAYLVPSEDSHGSEYISETDKRRVSTSQAVDGERELMRGNQLL